MFAASSSEGRCPSPPYQWLRWVITWHFSSGSPGSKGQGQIELSKNKSVVTFTWKGISSLASSRGRASFFFLAGLGDTAMGHPTVPMVRLVAE